MEIKNHYILYKEYPELMNKTIGYCERYLRKNGVAPTIIQVAYASGVTKEFAEAALKNWNEIGA